MSTNVVIRELRKRAEEAESDLARVKAALLAAETRAAVAEKSAQDSWSYVKAVLRLDTRRST